MGELRPGPGSSLPTDYQYTGQRNPGWGLYYFKARWFDSNLGRFAQADSIVPSTGFSIAWDRYAGMLNNPLKYVDPSGHDPYCTIYLDDQCVQMSDGTVINPNSQVSQRSSVSSKPRPMYSGEDIPWLYEQYKNDRNGWWYKDPLLGGDKDGFTIQDFFILILYYEMAGNIVGENAINQNKYAFAISEKYSYECARYSKGGTCGGISDNAMINYLAIRGSAWMRYDAVRFNHIAPSKVDPSKPGYNLNAATAVIKRALDSITPYGSQADWGNDEVTKQVYWTGPIGPPGIIYPPQNTQTLTYLTTDYLTVSY